MRRLFILYILTFSSISSFSQPKGYYFKDIKGTKWFSNKNIIDPTILDEAEIGLTIIDFPLTDTLKKNIWVFSDSLTLKFYDVNNNKHKTILTCKYYNDEKDKTITLKLNSGTEIKFEYNSISTGTYIGLWKEKKKRSNNHN